MRTWIVIGLVLAACNRSDGELEPRAPVRPPQPVRVAAEDEDLRVMLAELAASKACAMIRDQYRPLRAPDRPGVVTGTLWIRGCEITQRGTKITFRLGGQGWQWVDEVQEKAGGSFAVRQYVKFDVDATIPGTLDLAYARKAHVLSIWFSPTRRPDVEITPTGEIAVDEQGAWSSVLGAIGTLFAHSPEAAAEEAAADKGVAEFVAQWSDGLSVTVDLCKGLPRFNLGRPPQGKMLAPDVGETTEVPVELHPGGVMAFGPYLAPEGMTVRARVRDGAARLELVCADAAADVIEAYVARDDAGVAVKRLATEDVRDTATLKIKTTRCPVVVLARALGDAPATLEWARPQAEAAAAAGGPLIDC